MIEKCTLTTENTINDLGIKLAELQEDVAYTRKHA